MRKTYTAELFGDRYTMTADFAQASDQIRGDGCGRQVADFRHRPAAAMRAILQDAVAAGGDDPDHYADEINAAVDTMTQEAANT